MARKYPGKGTQIFFASASTVWVQLGQVVDIGDLGAPMGDRDITDLDSTAEEIGASMQEAQEVTVEVIYDNTADGHKQLAALCNTPSTSVVSMATGLPATVIGNGYGAFPFKVVLPTTTAVFAFNAVPKKLITHGITPKGTIMASFSMKTSGVINYPTTA